VIQPSSAVKTGFIVVVLAVVPPQQERRWRHYARFSYDFDLIYPYEGRVNTIRRAAISFKTGGFCFPRARVPATFQEALLMPFASDGRARSVDDDELNNLVSGIELDSDGTDDDDLSVVRQYMRRSEKFEELVAADRIKNSDTDDESEEESMDLDTWPGGTGARRRRKKRGSKSIVASPHSVLTGRTEGPAPGGERDSTNLQWERSKNSSTVSAEGNGDTGGGGGGGGDDADQLQEQRGEEIRPNSAAPPPDDCGPTPGTTAAHEGSNAASHADDEKVGAGAATDQKAPCDNDDDRRLWALRGEIRSTVRANSEEPSGSSQVSGGGGGTDSSSSSTHQQEHPGGDKSTGKAFDDMTSENLALKSALAERDQQIIDLQNALRRNEKEWQQKVAALEDIIEQQVANVTELAQTEEAQRQRLAMQEMELRRLRNASRVETEQQNFGNCMFELAHAEELQQQRMSRQEQQIDRMRREAAQDKKSNETQQNLMDDETACVTELARTEESQKQRLESQELEIHKLRRMVASSYDSAKLDVKKEFELVKMRSNEGDRLTAQYAEQVVELERRSGEVEKLATERGIAINILQHKVQQLSIAQAQDQSKRGHVVGALELENERLALRILNLERMGTVHQQSSSSRLVQPGATAVRMSAMGRTRSLRYGS